MSPLGKEDELTSHDIATLKTKLNAALLSDALDEVGLRQVRAEVVDVAYFAATREWETGELRFKNYWCCHAGVTGK